MGVFSLRNLAVDLYPEISFPTVLVITPYPGAGPEEVERSLVRPLEAAFAGLSGLEKMASSSQQNSGRVTLNFTFGTDLVDATNSIRDALERVRNALPDGAEMPIIFRFDPAMIPIVGLMISGNRTPEELRELAEDYIVPRIEQTPGVATASLIGGRERIIRVEIPQNRLEAYGLTVTQIQQVLAAQNVQISAGTIIENDLSFILTTMGEFTSIEQIANTVVSHRGGGMSGGQVTLPQRVQLRDLADVFESYRDETSTVLVNGNSSVMLFVQRQSGANSVQVARDLRTRLGRMTGGELPPDIGIVELFNTTDMVENSLNQVTSTAVYGAILCVLVLFLFLRAAKPTIIIGISIPVSIAITLMVMYFAGLTLNLMTMAGLILGIGLLVDNSIVILENIYQYREKGAKLKTSAILGSKEMLLAIMVSTLTTICVFAPMIMFQSTLGVSGEMFSGLAFTVVISLTISLFTAVFLVPVLASHYLPLVTRKQKPLTGTLAKIDRVFDNFLKWLDNSYRRLVDKILRRKAIVVITIAAIFVGSIFLIPVVGWVFMPAFEDDAVIVRATLPVGSPLPQTEAILRQLETIAKNDIQGYEALIVNAGPGGLFGRGNSNSGTLRINLPRFKDRIESAEEIKNMLRGQFHNFPGVVFNFEAAFGGGMGGSSAPIHIKLHTDDLVRGKETADKIAALLTERLPNITEPEVDLNDGLPQIEIIINRDRMYALGLNAFTVGSEIRAAVDGITATRFRTGGRDFNVVLILAEADRSTRPALDQIFVNSPIAGRVPLSSFVHYQEGTGPITIRRENQGRIINITAGAAKGTRVNVLQQEVVSLIASEIPVEDGLIIDFGGDQEELKKMMISFAFIAILAIVLVFGIMASLFESFKAPFIIIFTIPLSLTGIVLIYLLTGDTFNALTAVGLLVLIGIITNNGIVLVDYTNLLRKRGMPLHEACVEAAGSRLRPILMTTVSTILGLVPMAFFPGEGSELVSPIGKTVLGGLSFGTLMTLFLMPTVYFIMNKRSDERAAKALARRERIAAGQRRKDVQPGAGTGTHGVYDGATATPPVQLNPKEAGV